jgi:FkbM family methyltransferase
MIKKLHRYLKSTLKMRFLKFKENDKNQLFLEYLNHSFSQEGEDLILLRYFNNKKNGLFIDIGAHHPFRFSNTFLLYQQGWTGINVDANPGTKALFDKCRPKDINIEVGVSNKEVYLEYFSFKESALNTFSSELANTYIELGWELKEKIIVQTIPLVNIFETHLKSGTEIDLLTMDIEGYELEALKSNNWSRFRPKLLLIEILDFELENFTENSIYQYLKKTGYNLIAKTKNTVFFQDSSTS